MNGQEFYELTKKTRAAQKLYFRSRLQGDLITAKNLERDLDRAIASGLDEPVSVDQPSEPEQSTLFSEDGDEQNTEGN